jgi:ATP-dependent helicase/nuclease subunit B
MIKRVFWGWDRPVLEKSVALLTRDWRGGEFDLGDTLIIVPTAESARRLKEAMAHAAAEKGGAVSMPHVWPPERALLTREDRAVMAGDAETHLAWTKVLLEADLKKLPHLFPTSPSEKSWNWAVETASAMMDLATTLGAGGYAFADLPTAEGLKRDHDRWRELAVLEKKQRAVLHELGRREVQELKRERAASPVLPEGVTRVVVLPSPDLPRLFRDWLLAVSASVPVEIHVHAPKEQVDRFDAFGAPLMSAWGEKAGAVSPLRNEDIHLESDPAAQSRRVMEWLRVAVAESAVAIGVCDAEVTAHLEERLEREGVRLYEPGGGLAEQHGTVQMLLKWAELAASDDWRAFAALLRVPVVLESLGDARGAFGTRVIEAADNFAAKHLPVTLTHALELADRFVAAHEEDRRAVPAKLLEVMNAAREVAGAFARESLPDAARALLVRLFGGRRYRPDDAADCLQVEVCSAWLVRCEELQTAAMQLGLGACTPGLLAMSLDWLRGQQMSDPRGEIDLVLVGWLELLWEPAPALMISGFNEEHVPGVLISHPFLPDRLREALGLACQASRYARDAYLLCALAAQRLPGRLRVCCGLWSDGKDSLRPSRLLFLCDAASLVSRVHHLFPKDLDKALPRQPARRRLWKLKPPLCEVRKPEGISSTRLRAYLSCPFRYYLDHVLRMERVDAAPLEWDATVFGDVIHETLRVLLTDEGRACGGDEQRLAALLCERAQAIAHARHGSRLPVPVRLQLDSAMQRLRAAARVEAELRQQGWHIERSEVSFGGADDADALLLDGVRFSGRIDRVDGNSSGLCRVIDYKTGDKAPSPVEAHLKQVKSPGKLGEEERWMTFVDSGGVTCRWLDLQLPLYVKAWSLRTKGVIEGAYFQLPKAVDGTALAVFDELDAEMIEAAVACAEEAVSRIKRGIFWPPAQELRAEDYPGLIHGRAVDTFDFESLRGN